MEISNTRQKQGKTSVVLIKTDNVLHMFCPPHGHVTEATEPRGAAMGEADLPRYLSPEKYLEKGKNVLPAENTLLSSQNETQQFRDNAPSGAGGLSQPQTQRSGWRTRRGEQACPRASIAPCR